MTLNSDQIINIARAVHSKFPGQCIAVHNIESTEDMDAVYADWVEIGNPENHGTIVVDAALNAVEV